jgi:ABC-type polysaccharide/polyol phosphate export permease
MAVRTPSNIDKAVQDIASGVANVHLWSILGWQEVRLRYRRSVLGPFWLTISTGLLIAAMGPLYGRLFGHNISDYFPHLAIGFVVWQLIAGLINEGCNAFIAAEGMIKQTRIPLTVHVLRVVIRNLIIFAHNLAIVAVVMAIYPPGLNWGLLLVPLGLLAIATNGVWVGMLAGLLCARFRDIPPIVQSLVQVSLFLTPVLWKAGSLGRYEWVASWNPFYHFVEVVRAPLMGLPLPLQSWLAVFGISAAGFALTFVIFARYRARIAYWV